MAMIEVHGRDSSQVVPAGPHQDTEAVLGRCQRLIICEHIGIATDYETDLVPSCTCQDKDMGVLW